MTDLRDLPKHLLPSLFLILDMIAQRREAEPRDTALWRCLDKAADAMSLAIEAETRATALSDLAEMGADLI